MNDSYEWMIIYDIPNLGRYVVAESPSGTVPDLRPQGRGSEPHQRLLCTNANSACHPSEYQRKLGSKRAYHAMH